jgi:iron(II)-dependent oxidoreductase
MRFGYLFLIHSCILALTPAFADDQDSGLTFPSEYRFTIIQPAKGSGETGNSGVERIRVPEGEFLIKRSQDAPLAEGTLPEKILSESAITAKRAISHTPDIEPDIENMVLVPEGEAIIGLPEGVPGSDRNPLRTLAFKTYLIDKYEVTNAQYKKCVEAGGCNIPSLIVDYPPTFHQEGKDWYKDSTKDDYPVVGLTWKQAGDYCRWAGKKLPTAAEWEKAARGSDGWTFPWGNTWDGTKANWDDDGKTDGFEKIAAVGKFPQGASPFGAEDMAGNVREWVDDLVLKGGSWYSNPNSLRPGDPGHEYIVERDDDMGFRCIKDVSP